MQYTHFENPSRGFALQKLRYSNPIVSDVV